jgi:hypothetical protein
MRAEAARGRRVPTRGPITHKGRVGEGVERLLLGARVGSAHAADHPAAELKSVPVRGERVLERVKLGVLSARAHPLDKCARTLFVFVEERGRDVFVAGHACVEFAPSRWLALWRAGMLVETAAGISGDEARGLYLVPRFFLDEGLWPLAHMQPFGRQSR